LLSYRTFWKSEADWKINRSDDKIRNNPEINTPGSNTGSSNSQGENKQGEMDKGMIHWRDRFIFGRKEGKLAEADYRNIIPDP